MKTCTKCGVEKPLDEFTYDKRQKDGRVARCRKCDAARKRDKYATDPAYAQRMREHARVNRRGENLDPVGTARPVNERFDEKWVEDENGCHIWQARINAYGYGEFSVNGSMVLAHRVSYALEYGPIPDGLELHHTCQVRACVRPGHLLAVTEEAHRELHRELHAQRPA